MESVSKNCSMCYGSAEAEVELGETIADGLLLSKQVISKLIGTKVVTQCDRCGNKIRVTLVDKKSKQDKPAFDLSSWKLLPDYFCYTCSTTAVQNPDDVGTWGCPVCNFTTVSVSIFFGNRKDMSARW